MSDETGPQLTTYQRLAAPFEISEHAKVPKGGMTQTYAPWTAYVERLNTVLGQDWSFRVVREGFTSTECWVLGEITAVIDGVTVVRQQYGCEPIVKGQRETPTTDLIKTAASDAIKKASSLLGVGLYLSIKEEREAIEAAMREASKPAPKGQGTANTSNARTTAPSTTAGAQAVDPKVDAAAKLTGADPTPIKPMVRCTECAKDVAKDGSVTILKKKDGPKVTVQVSDFEPVCIERLGSFHCARCYDRKYWGAA